MQPELEQQLKQQQLEQMLPLLERTRGQLVRVRVRVQQLALEQQQEQLLLSCRMQPRQRQR
jgi:hypothetical protein